MTIPVNQGLKICEDLLLQITKTLNVPNLPAVSKERLIFTKELILDYKTRNHKPGKMVIRKKVAPEQKETQNE